MQIDRFLITALIVGFLVGGIAVSILDSYRLTPVLSSILAGIKNQ